MKAKYSTIDTKATVAPIRGERPGEKVCALVAVFRHDATRVLQAAVPALRSDVTSTSTASNRTGTKARAHDTWARFDSWMLGRPVAPVMRAGPQ